MQVESLAGVHPGAASASRESKFWGLSLFAAPLFLAASTFFWEDGKLGLAGGTLQVYSLLFWALSCFAIYFRLLLTASSFMLGLQAFLLAAG